LSLRRNIWGSSVVVESGTEKEVQTSSNGGGLTCFLSAVSTPPLNFDRDNFNNHSLEIHNP